MAPVQASAIASSGKSNCICRDPSGTNIVGVLYTPEFGSIQIGNISVYPASIRAAKTLQTQSDISYCRCTICKHDLPPSDRM